MGLFRKRLLSSWNKEQLRLQVNQRFPVLFSLSVHFIKIVSRHCLEKLKVGILTFYLNLYEQYIFQELVYIFSNEREIKSMKPSG